MQFMSYCKNCVVSGNLVYYQGTGISCVNWCQNMTISDNVVIKLDSVGGSTFGGQNSAILLNYQYSASYDSTWDPWIMRNIVISNNIAINEFGAAEYAFSITPTHTLNAVTSFWTVENLVVANNVFEGNVLLNSNNKTGVVIQDNIFSNNRVTGSYERSTTDATTNTQIIGGSVAGAISITDSDGFNFKNVFFEDDVAIGGTATDCSVYNCHFATGKALTMTGASNHAAGNITDGVQASPEFSGTITIGSAEVDETELEILDGATVTTDELNILDGSATVQATVTLAGTDGVVISDGDVMKQCLVSDIPTYTESATQTLTNKTFDADGAGNSITNIENADIKAAAAIDASKIADGTVSDTEFQYISTLSSNAQTQFNNIAVKTTGVTVGTPGDGGVDFTWTADADANAQNLDLGAIVPAKSRIIGVEIICTETVTSSAGAVDITMRAGNASAGEQFIVSLSCDDENEVVGVIDSTKLPAVIMDWSSATNVWLGGNPDQDWDTLTAGQWAVYVTYITYI